MPPKKKPPSFEQALARLEELTQSMENDEQSLEDTLKMYEEGQGLIGQCQDLLSQAKKRVQKLQAKSPELPEGDTLFDLEEFV